MIAPPRRLLLLGAHADDETIGAGGTLARYAALGVSVSVAIATDSTSMQYPGDGPAAERRRHHLEAAIDELGVGDLSVGDFPDMRLAEVPHVELNAWVVERIAAAGADTVLVHHPSDVNLDHVALFRSTMIATRPSPNCPVRSLYCYFTQSSSEWGFGAGGERFLPQCHVDIDATLDRKLAALACYADELRDFPHPRSAEALEHAARQLGSTVGVRAAEAFQLVRSIC